VTGVVQKVTRASGSGPPGGTPAGEHSSRLRRRAHIERLCPLAAGVRKLPAKQSFHREAAPQRLTV